MQVLPIINISVVNPLLHLWTSPLSCLADSTELSVAKQWCSFLGVKTGSEKVT